MSNNLIESEHALLSIGREHLPPEAVLVLDGADLTATQRYVYAAWLSDQIFDMYNEEESVRADEGSAMGIGPSALEVALKEAESSLEAAREAWLACDEPRAWLVGGDSWGGGCERIDGVRPSEIDERLDALAHDADYPEQAESMVMYDWAESIDPVTNKRIGDRVHTSNVIDPPPPGCVKGDGCDEDSWERPHSVVGGLRENPGVSGHGGGVIVREVCSRCGCYRVTDTWAQDERGQIYEAVSYEPADEDSEAWIGELREDS